MPKIHFASLFGVDLDYDIIVQWCAHYASMKYDTYTVFLHSIDPSSTRFQFIRRAMKVSGFTVIEAPAVPYTTQMRNDLLDGFAKSLDPLDYLVVADSDEFHSTGPWTSNFRDLIMSCDVLYGKLVDRWADSLIEANPTLPLDEQYPHAGDIFKIVFARTRDPERERWHAPVLDKILAARAGLPVSHVGSHTLYRRDVHTKERHSCIVNHYKWRQSLFDRLKTKWYYKESYDSAVADFFHCDIAKCKQLEGVPV